MIKMEKFSTNQDLFMDSNMRIYVRLDC